MSKNTTVKMLLDFTEKSTHSHVDYNLLCIDNATKYASELVDFMAEVENTQVEPKRKIQFVQAVHEKLMDCTDFLTYVDRGINCMYVEKFAKEITPLLKAMRRS